MRGLPGALQKPIGKPATFSTPSSSSISSTIGHISISSTTPHTPPSVSHTINSRTHCHTIEHLHHTNTTTPTKTTTPVTSSITTLISIMSPKQPRRKKIKKLAPPVSTTTISTIITPKNTSVQITIPKRKTPTLRPFISTDFRLKQRKSYSLPFTHHRTSLTTPPTAYLTTSLLPPPPPPRKSHPTPKFQPLSQSAPPTLLCTSFPLASPLLHMSLPPLFRPLPWTPPPPSPPSLQLTPPRPTIPPQQRRPPSHTQNVPPLIYLDIPLPPRRPTHSLSLTIPLASSLHTRSSFSRSCWSFSSRGSEVFSYQTNKSDPRKSPSLGDSEDVTDRIKAK